MGDRERRRKSHRRAKQNRRERGAGAEFAEKDHGVKAPFLLFVYAAPSARCACSGLALKGRSSTVVRWFVDGCCSDGYPHSSEERLNGAQSHHGSGLWFALFRRERERMGTRAWVPSRPQVSARGRREPGAQLN